MKKKLLLTAALALGLSTTATAQLSGRAIYNQPLVPIANPFECAMGKDYVEALAPKIVSSKTPNGDEQNFEQVEQTLKKMAADGGFTEGSAWLVMSVTMMVSDGYAIKEDAGTMFEFFCEQAFDPFAQTRPLLNKDFQ